MTDILGKAFLAFQLAQDPAAAQKPAYTPTQQEIDAYRTDAKTKRLSAPKDDKDVAAILVAQRNREELKIKLEPAEKISGFIRNALDGKALNPNDIKSTADAFFKSGSVISEERPLYDGAFHYKSSAEARAKTFGSERGNVGNDNRITQGDAGSQYLLNTIQTLIQELNPSSAKREKLELIDTVLLQSMAEVECAKPAADKSKDISQKWLDQACAVLQVAKPTQP